MVNRLETRNFAAGRRRQFFAAQQAERRRDITKRQVNGELPITEPTTFIVSGRNGDQEVVILDNGKKN